MKVKEIKCPNCGAKLNPKHDSNGIVRCEFCKAEFSIESDYSKSYNMAKGMFDAKNDSINDALDNIKSNEFYKNFNKTSKLATVFIGFAICFIIFVIVFFVIKTYKDSFNWDYEHKDGTQSHFSTSDIFDDVIKNNQKRNKKIELCLDDVCSKEINELAKLKNNITSDYEYEILLNYKNGFVNKIIITTKNN